jgi:hypothetical protein
MMVDGNGGRVDKPVFKPDFFRELARENPLGLTLHWREAEAWFNFIAWPAYKTYKYRRHSAAVRRWWANLTMKDLERAREAMENVKLERAQAQQDELVAGVQEFYPENVIVLHKILGGKGGRSE